MNKWYLCAVAYERQGDEMGLRKVSESYLVDALSFTEAEERIIKEVTPFVSCGVLEVVNIRPIPVWPQRPPAPPGPPPTEPVSLPLSRPRPL